MDYVTSNVTLIINFIAAANFIICLSAACCYLALTRKATEFVFVAFGVVLLDVIHQLMRYELKKYFGCQECLEVVNALWFMGYALTDLILILVLNFIFSKNRMLKDKASQIIIYCYLAMSFIQIATYVERVYTNAEAFTYLYQVIIPIINLGVTFVLCGFVLKLVLLKLGKGFLFFYMSIGGNK
ncbi:MAG: hypothetical protein GW836_00765 [Paraglaciecola sp.]|nr:hypothetical protein [Paraglaciecola sp.]